MIFIYTAYYWSTQSVWDVLSSAFPQSSGQLIISSLFWKFTTSKHYLEVLKEQVTLVLVVLYQLEINSDFEKKQLSKSIVNNDASLTLVQVKHFTEVGSFFTL